MGCCPIAEHNEPTEDSMDGEYINLETNQKPVYYSQSNSFTSQIAEKIEIKSYKNNVESKNVQLNQFELLKLLGKGALGKVVLVRKKKSRSLYAMKIMKKTDIQKSNQKSRMQDERLILETIQSPFIVTLHYAFQTKDKLYLVTDFCQGGELFYHLRQEYKFNEEKSRFYSAEILLALECLHQQGIIYRDLKPENILINSDGHLKLTDFGLSKFRNTERTHSIVGTPAYIAPEILLSQAHTTQCDIWSLGALIYEMLSGCPPFYSTNNQVMFKNRLEKPIDMKPWFSNSAQSLIQGLLCNDPKYRMRIDEIKIHEFFKNIDWNLLAKKQIKPPFIPILNSPTDLKYFDEVFTKEAIDDSNNSDGSTNEAYSQFTYCNTQRNAESIYSSNLNQEL